MTPKKWGFTVKQGAITGHGDNYTAFNITKPSLTMQLEAATYALLSPLVCIKTSSRFSQTAPMYVIHFLQFIDFHQSPDTRSARTKHNAQGMKWGTWICALLPKHRGLMLHKSPFHLTKKHNRPWVWWGVDKSNYDSVRFQAKNLLQVFTKKTESGLLYLR